ncbi:isoprenylcysteine carboxylmethyltransferase family protein [Candidatus Nephthysia bennettiae]|uniref:Isoprenylcysteine carboxylmethyltransferase family protein n=1 Tax=Candidatus Nephthysia bennettiae TaxID=3127016 RepID=A0A934KBL2_9BACT|nr:isoprenylcysteine carboxylmethyltransferase family protein [Candidatus Dormibacteraeota bacterium]MBJ7611802.1 isoprenylcysteine carboxylmethyltransferase family protein [Candidatus Dormibacteraeota bacterium]
MVVGGFDVVELLWLGFILYWLVAARRTASTRVREGVASSLVSNAALVLGALLLLGSAFPLGPLDARWVPAHWWVLGIGAVLTAAGLGLAVWARRHLGRNWSAQPSLKLDHQLIQTGPYAVIRHPIYSGILLALLGTALYLGQYRALLGLALFVAGLWWKARREEALLVTQFGDDYQRHRLRAGMFLPRLRHPA